MAKKDNSGNGMNPVLVPVLIIAVIVIGAAYFMSQEGGDVAITTGDISGGDQGNYGGDGGDGGYVPPAPPAASASINSGELELFLKDSQGKTGTASSVLLLDAAAHWKGTNEATRYDVMRTLSEKGLDGLVSFNGGTPKAISVTSGEWSEAQLVGHVGDQVVVYTYVDNTPAAVENASTARLMTLSDFYRETGKYVAQGMDGKASWNLYNYANYTFRDGADVQAFNYTYGDSGSADYNQVITWYSRANLVGEECVDCSIYLKAPSNFTSKFKNLAITDKSGHSMKFTTLNKAENFPSGDPRSIGASVLTAALDPFDWYYLGDVPADFVTLYTSGDANRMTWELTTDTYGTNITLSVAIVQNGGALISANGAFQTTTDFDVALTSATASGINLGGRDV